MHNARTSSNPDVPRRTHHKVLKSYGGASKGIFHRVLPPGPSPTDVWPGLFPLKLQLHSLASRAPQSVPRASQNIPQAAQSIPRSPQSVLVCPKNVAEHSQNASERRRASLGAPGTFQSTSENAPIAFQSFPTNVPERSQSVPRA